MTTGVSSNAEPPSFHKTGRAMHLDTRRADDAGRKNLGLLIQLRWIAVGGQVATMIVVGTLLHVALPIAPMVIVLIALVGLNLVSLARLVRTSPVTNGELFTALMLDVGALTMQFYLTGGATNPFTFLYLLQVTLGAILLDAWSIWIMVAVTGLCFAGLTQMYRVLDLTTIPGQSLFALHIDGMLICFVLDAALLVVFVTRISGNLREQDARLAAMRQHAAEEDHIVRMGLLASGAAHELGTPLSTLSVILGDWRRMPALTGDAELASEIASMEAEVRRCKAIVTGILVSAGETRGESATVTTLHTFLDDLVEEWRETRSVVSLAYGRMSDDDMPIVSDTSLKQVIFNVLDNAYEASPDWLGFDAMHDGTQLTLSFADRGDGFRTDFLDRIGTPYQSTKGRPGGGLGLYLVFNVVRKLGGTTTASNRPERGALVTLTLPLRAFSLGLRTSHGE